MRAEAHESWTARFSRMFDDMHLVWIGLASTAATVVCGAVVLGMLQFASPERDDSLAAIIAVAAAPSGSDLNPMSLSLDDRIQAPSVPEDGFVRAALESSGSGREMMLAFSAVITREGRIYGLEVLGNDHDHRQVAPFIDAVSTRSARAGALWRRSDRGEPRLVRRAHDGQGEAARVAQRYRLMSATAVATLFIASVARMITLRAESSSSSVTSNSSSRESAMPSTGNAARHRLASSEYSTR